MKSKKQKRMIGIEKVRHGILVAIHQMGFTHMETDG